MNQQQQQQDFLAERKAEQIVRKDGKNVFVEVLKDSFPINRIHLAFSSYDKTKPAGQRITAGVHIYLTVGEFLVLCSKIECGMFLDDLNAEKSRAAQAGGYPNAIFESLGGTSAKKLAKYGRPRPDGKSLSRVCKIIPGSKFDMMLLAECGPGNENEKGLIVPAYGNKPENRVQVPMKWETFAEMLLETRAHYYAFVASKYAGAGAAPAAGNANASSGGSESDEMIRHYAAVLAGYLGAAANASDAEWTSFLGMCDEHLGVANLVQLWAKEYVESGCNEDIGEFFDAKYEALPHE